MIEPVPVTNDKSSDDERYMRIAIDQAKIASENGDVLGIKSFCFF